MANERDTRVLISFGAVEGGFEFTAQLRNEIYAKFKKSRETDPSFCYLDAESLLDHQATTSNYNRVSDKYMSRNPDWLALYKQAILRCRTIIILLTKEWLDSKYCIEELGLIFASAKTKPHLKSIVVEWPDAQPVLSQGAWLTRHGTGADGKTILSQLSSLPNLVRFKTAGGSPVRGEIQKRKRTYDNAFNYACDENDLGRILRNIIV